MTDYTYSVANDTANGTADAGTLREQVNADPAVTVHCSAVTIAADVLTVTMLAALSGAEQTALGDVVAAHDGAPAPAVPLKVQPTTPDYGGSSHWLGDHFTANASDDTERDFLIATAGALAGGTFWCDDNAVIGDTVTFQIVDVDGVLSPPGTVLKEYVTALRVVPGERRALASGQSAAVAAGLYVRTTYHATGQAPVEVLYDLLMFQ